jgi:hypothetical protein
VYSKLSKIIYETYFVILHAYHAESAYLLVQGCENPWLFFEDKGVWDKKYLENADVEEGSATFGRTACRGKRRTRSERIFQE